MLLHGRVRRSGLPPRTLQVMMPLPLLMTRPQPIQSQLPRREVGSSSPASAKIMIGADSSEACSTEAACLKHIASLPLLLPKARGRARQPRLCNAAPSQVECYLVRALLLLRTSEKPGRVYSLTDVLFSLRRTIPELILNGLQLAVASCIGALHETQLA